MDPLNIIQKLKRCLSILLYSPLAFFFYLLKVEIPYFFVERIGHFLLDPDCYLKEHILKNGSLPKSILLAPSNFVSNKEVSNLWRQYFYVFENPILCRILEPLSFHPIRRFKRKAFTANEGETADSFYIYSKWHEKKPLLRLSDEQEALGDDLLKDIGINENDWFVCFHNREGGYAPEDENIQRYRNFPFSDFSLAIEFINSKGGKCVRMGDNSMEPSSHPLIIDYATSEYKSEILDLILGKRAKLFLGCTSGASLLSTIFGVPVAHCNMAPVTAVGMSHRDISIPMLLKDKNSNKILTIKEMITSDLANIRDAEVWSAKNVDFVKNSPKEILELLEELYQRVEGTYKSDQQANKLNEEFKSMLRHGDFCFGASSRIGSKFINKYYY